MRFFFAWVSSGEVFDPNVHAREDLQVFHVRIQEEEGTFPQADVKVKLQDMEWIESRQDHEALISMEMSQGSVLIFRGRLLRCPHVMGEGLLTLHLTAEPLDVQAQLDALYPQLWQKPYIDPLFMNSRQQTKSDPRALLDARAAAIYWSRTTQKASLSSLLMGAETIYLKSTYDADKLTVKLAQVPYDAVEIQLVASWCQRVHGSARLDHVLQAYLPDGLISTLTGTDLEKKWWRTGQSLQRSGYEILESRLEPMSFTSTGVMNLYPQRSRPFWVYPADPILTRERKAREKPRQIRFKRSWYRPHLKIGWHYTQKREETINIRLANDYQTLGFHQPNNKKISIRLQNITGEDGAVPWVAERWYPKGERVIYEGMVYQCLRSHQARSHLHADQESWRYVGPETYTQIQEMRGTFFATDRGHEAISHALEVAQAHLAVSTRAIEIQLVCPLVDAWMLTCHHSVQVNDPRLPGGQALGKVIAISFHIDGETGVAEAHIRLGCCIGKGRIYPLQKESTVLYGPELFEPTVMREEYWQQTPSGVSYRAIVAEVPGDRFMYPFSMGPSDLLRRVDIVNDAVAQQEILREGQYPKTSNLQALLNTAKTRIVIHLEDLRTRDVLRHQIDLLVPYPWSGPRQIDLSKMGGNDEISLV